LSSFHVFAFPFSCSTETNKTNLLLLLLFALTFLGKSMLSSPRYAYSNSKFREQNVAFQQDFAERLVMMQWVHECKSATPIESIIATFREFQLEDKWNRVAAY
jgi:hypothetical protein